MVRLLPFPEALFNDDGLLRPLWIFTAAFGNQLICQVHCFYNRLEFPVGGGGDLIQINCANKHSGERGGGGGDAPALALCK